MDAKKETPEEPTNVLFTLLDNKGQEGREDGWKDWHDTHTLEATRQIKSQMEIKTLTSNAYAFSLHMGLMIMHGTNHPIFNKLTPDEQVEINKVYSIMKKAFNTNTDGGIYGTFFTRLNAAR